MTRAARRKSGTLVPVIGLIAFVGWAERSVPTMTYLRRGMVGTALRAFAHPTRARSMRPCQTERHHLLQRRFHRRGREQRQRVDRHGAVMMGAADGVFQ